MNLTLPPISSTVLWMIASTYLALAIGTLTRLVCLRGQSSKIARQRVYSLRSWWLVATLVCVASVGGASLAAALFAIVSMLAFREFAEFIPPRPLETYVRRFGFAFILATYVALAAGIDAQPLLASPLIGGIVVAGMLATTDRLPVFIQHVSGFMFAITITTSMPAFAVLLLQTGELPTSDGPILFLMLIGLTEANDIASALIGRRFGQRPLARKLSPMKTREGFLGGVLVTVLLAMLLGPILVSWGIGQSALAGLLIAIAATLGDLNMSAVKRCTGVKDSGDVLPGQGGVLDRIDSLTFSAPAFYLLIWWWQR